MDHTVSFGYWVRRRRKLLDLTQADLALKVSCSLSMLRKIERDERRPSSELAELLADHLAVTNSQREPFIQMARGQYVSRLPTPAEAAVSLIDRSQELGKRQEARTPFVGRKRELVQLHGQLDLALAGQGRILFIAGEAGRGKTSLLYEFTRQALASHPELLAAGGSSDVYAGLGDPLMPFRDIFRMLAGDIENSGMSGIISQDLAARLARALSDTASVVLDWGPHLIDTLIPGSALEARLAKSFSQNHINTELLMKLQDRRARLSSPAVTEIHQDRLFEEISATLSTLARRQPLLLMLDDLHWIDHSSAGLLGHLAMRLQQSPIFIVGSFRPEDLARGQQVDDKGRVALHPLQNVLSESQRQFGQNRIDLDHPEPEEELDFVNALLDADENDIGIDFRKRLAHLTEGHPLFVVELIRDMKELGDIVQGSDGRWFASESISWDHLPARVEGVIEKRISRLPDELRDLLTVASVQGETFFAEVIAKVRGMDALRLTRRLSAELDRGHRLISESGVKRAGSTRLSQYRFRHHLFQKYIYGRLASGERMYLHEIVGKALEGIYLDQVSRDELPAGQLARHFQEAHLGVKASEYLLLAGRNAAQIIAYDEAATFFEQGLALLEIQEHQEAQEPVSEIRQLEFDLSLDLARAYWHSGRVAEALSSHGKSIDVAHGLGDAERLAHAVLAYEEPRWRLNLNPQTSQDYMREAMAALGDEESPLRVRLLVNLSRALLTAGDQEELGAIVEEALLAARRIDDPVALCEALRISTQIDRRPETSAARLAAVEEMMAVAKTIDDQERLADALDLYVYDQLELGHIEQVDKTIAEQRRVAQEIKQPFQLHIAAVFLTMRAIMRGEFVEAERLAKEAAEISQQIGLAELDGILGIHMFTIRWEQGRLNEIAPFVKLYVANNPSSASWLPGLALIYRTLGMKDECRVIFEQLVSDSFAYVPQDSLRVASLAYLAEVCTYLSDADSARTLYELLIPYDRRTVVVGGATACYGAAGRFLGMLASTMSDWDTAEGHFKKAIELDSKMEAWPWLAHTKYEYAAMLLARGQEDDRPRAHSMLDEALSSGERMDMAYLVHNVKDLFERYEFA